MAFLTLVSVLERIIADLMKHVNGLLELVKKLTALASALTRSPKRRRVLKSICKRLGIAAVAPTRYGEARFSVLLLVL